MSHSMILKFVLKNYTMDIHKSYWPTSSISGLLVMILNVKKHLFGYKYAMSISAFYTFLLFLLILFVNIHSSYIM